MPDCPHSAYKALVTHTQATANGTHGGGGVLLNPQSAAGVGRGIPGSASLRGATDCWGKGRGGEGRRDWDLCPLPGPAQTWPRTALCSATPQQGSPDSREPPTQNSGVALRLPRELSCLITGSVQAQPPGLLFLGGGYRHDSPLPPLAG